MIANEQYVVRFVGYREHLTTVHPTMEAALEHIMGIIRKDVEKNEFYRFLPVFEGLRLAILSNNWKKALQHWNDTSLEEIQLEIVPLNTEEQLEGAHSCQTVALI